MEIKKAILVLADISGYTNFITKRETSLLHAERIITDLLEAVIDAAEFPLTLNKLEGDAAFLYALSDENEAAAAQDVARQVMAFVQAFNAKAVKLVRNTEICECDGCQHIHQLRLKVLLHAGEVALKRVRQFEELAGEAVIRIHRLLKNSVQADEYILLTEEFYQLCGGLPGVAQTPDRLVEQAEGLGAVPVRVYYPPTEGRAAPAPRVVKPWQNWRSFLYIKWISRGRRSGKQFAHLPQ